MVSKTYHHTEIATIAKNLLEDHPSTQVFCFYGDMGAGKTTLIKELLLQLGAIDAGNSPTFGVVNEHYDTQGELLAYHFDCYRLKTEDEAYDFGMEEYFNRNTRVFIEWPERIPNLIPQQHLSIKLHFIDENERFIEY